MPESIIWTLNVQIAGGPTQSVARLLTVDAYDVINVNIDAAPAPGQTTDQAIVVQPAAQGEVEFLMITSSAYDADLTYTQGGANDPEVALEGPHVLPAASLVALLGPTPQSLTFSNPLMQRITISILVGRQA